MYFQRTVRDLPVSVWGGVRVDWPSSGINTTLELYYQVPRVKVNHNALIIISHSANVKRILLGHFKALTLLTI